MFGALKPWIAYAVAGLTRCGTMSGGDWTQSSNVKLQGSKGTPDHGLCAVDLWGFNVRSMERTLESFE